MFQTPASKSAPLVPPSDSRFLHMPTKMSPTTLKIYQRMAMAKAVDQQYSRAKTSDEDKYATCFQDYSSSLDMLLLEYKDIIPAEIKNDKLLLMKIKVTSSDEAKNYFTPKTLWKNWMDSNRNVTNKMLPLWCKMVPGDGRLPSGVQTWDAILLDFRKQYFAKLEEEKADKKKAKGRKVVNLVEDSQQGKEEVDEEVEEEEDEEVNEEQDVGEGDSQEQEVGGIGMNFKKTKEFSADWFPIEWGVFLFFGPLAENPYRAWTQFFPGHGRNKFGKPKQNRKEQREALKETKYSSNYLPPVKEEPTAKKQKVSNSSFSSASVVPAPSTELQTFLLLQLMEATNDPVQKVEFFEKACALASNFGK